MVVFQFLSFLGFYIRDGVSVRLKGDEVEKVQSIFISRLVSNGLAAMTGLLAIDDEVLEVNSIDVTGKTLDQVFLPFPNITLQRKLQIRNKSHLSHYKTPIVTFSTEFSPKSPLFDAFLNSFRTNFFVCLSIS